MATTRGVSRLVIQMAIAATITVLVKGLYPVDLPASASPDFIDNVFDNRGVLWAARLLLVSAAAVLAFGGTFIALSIGMRMKNGQWLRRAGPFEISEGKLGQAEAEVGFWRQIALTQLEEGVNLRERLSKSEELIDTLRGSR
jgi:hypothetical protein